MTEQHTPGPWTVEYNTDYYTDADAEDIAARYVTGIRGADGTNVYYTEGGYFKGKPGDVALIVAAPDLLAALESLLAEMNAMGWGDSLETRDADAAIAKARGA